MPTIEVILAEFGPTRSNAGGGNLPRNRLEPSVSSFQRHFPEARFTCFTDQEWEIPGVAVVRVPLTFDTHHGRWGWRENDLWLAKGLLESKADMALALDSDLLVVDDRIRALVPLTEKFGFLMPPNGRHIVWKDARSSCDGGKVEDPSLGMGSCLCTAFWSFWTKASQFRPLLERYCQRMIDDAKTNRGARGPLVLWRACWDTGIMPAPLPIHYCVTGSNLYVQDPVCLHVGHEAVAKQYQDLVNKYK